MDILSVSQQLKDLWETAAALELRAGAEAKCARLEFQAERNRELPEMWNRFDLANYNHKRTKQLMAAFEYGTRQHKKSKPVCGRFWSPEEVQHLVACADKMTGVGAFYIELYSLFKLKPTRRSFEAVRKKAQRLGICP